MKTISRNYLWLVRDNVTYGKQGVNIGVFNLATYLSRQERKCYTQNTRFSGLDIKW